MLKSFIPKSPSFNFTYITSAIVVFSSLLVGVVSAYVAYSVGTDSLEGVNTPPENPTQKIGNDRGKNTENRFEFISERTILVKVYDHIHKQKEAAKAQSKPE